MDGWGERERGISRLSSLPRIALLGEDESCILSAPSEREYSVLCYKCTVWERRPSVALPMQNLTRDTELLHAGDCSPKQIKDQVCDILYT